MKPRRHASRRSAQPSPRPAPQLHAFGSERGVGWDASAGIVRFDSHANNVSGVRVGPVAQVSVATRTKHASVALDFSCFPHARSAARCLRTHRTFFLKSTATSVCLTLVGAAKATRVVSAWPRADRLLPRQTHTHTPTQRARARRCPTASSATPPAMWPVSSPCLPTAATAAVWASWSSTSAT